MRRLSRTLAIALLLVGCGDARVTEPVTIDLIRLFRVSDEGPPTTRIQLAAPASRESLLHGWTEPQEAPDGTRGLGIERFQATVAVRIERDPGPLELIVDRVLVTPDGPHRPAMGVRVFLNGLYTGSLSPRESHSRLRLRERIIRPGRNVLAFRYMNRPRQDPARPHAQYLYRAIEILSRAPATPSPFLADEDTLVLPAGTSVRLYLRAPDDTRLLASAEAEAGRLVVRTQEDGQDAYLAADLAVDGRRAVDVALPLAPVTIAAIELTATGDGPVRLHAPRVEGTEPTHAAAAIPDAPSAPPRRNVLLYVADTLRADALGVYAPGLATSPVLDRLAQHSIVFEQAIAQSSWTRPAVASIMTGRYPGAHGAISLRDRVGGDIETLAQRFKTAGYATAGFVTNVNVARVFGFARGFDEYRYLPEDFDTEEVHVPAGRLHDEAAAWLEAHHAGPFLLYVHATDPHTPYTPAADVAERFRPPGLTVTLDEKRPLRSIDAPGARMTADDVLYLRSLYDAEVAGLDAELGRLLARLTALGVADDTIVVFVADHGEEFRDHGGFEHGNTLFQELVHVPLMIHVPGVTDDGQRTSVLARQIDLLPTLLTLVGLPVPDGLPGRPLLTAAGTVLPRPEEEAVSTTWFHHTALTALVMPPWKVILPDRGDAQPKLFDLRSDPHERHDLAAQHPVLVEYARLRAAELQEAPPAEASPPVELDAATRERLRRLGYVVD